MLSVCEARLSENIILTESDTTCSHAISVIYFAETINTKRGFYCFQDDFYDFFNGVPINQPVCHLIGEYIDRRLVSPLFK